MEIVVSVIAAFLFLTTIGSFVLLYRFITLAKKFIEFYAQLPEDNKREIEPQADTLTFDEEPETVPLNHFYPSPGVKVKVVDDEDHIHPLDELERVESPVKSRENRKN